ncbi:hypothetical protein M9Y10_042476 [Tritrichomonas musculus]|uniref:Uncharacterized protein n=1 Tax=Tritrichomonas musculus TaxID=1915356 RepID=A0ABR2GNR5_9EUKA
MEIDKRDFIAMNNNSSKVAIERNSSFLMNCYAKICKDENQSTKEEFIKYYKEAIDIGNTDSMCRHALMLEEEFIKYYKEAIDIGNTDSMCRHALMLEEEFIKYYKVAIERDSSFLMNCYAKIFKDENQSTKEEFIKYYKEAIDKAYKLALMIQNGDGINTYK